ncbi:hypothetical protein C4D60_Mb00t17320 [Musa balbisiana]|uniref:Uncharacterized protein n=1 Tax=Musa balbisiana TaxID=52838 RepID=A0A4S8I7L7_MUSBA|nr:hypothetical protein C4D60_Mb00t17320 [Musa balbisiana]
MHAVIDRQKNHGIHFRVLAKALRMSGGDHNSRRPKSRYFLHSRLGLYARCSARGFRGYSCLAYACSDRNLWGCFPYYSLAEEGGTLGQPLGNAPGCAVAIGWL